MANLNIELPTQVKEVLNRLDAYTYRAYIVGRCVRELINGESAVDFDIITNAEMERILAIFDTYSINVDNIKKGEVIVSVQGMPVLIAPFRSFHSDNGSPGYCETLREDLMRRDFSINAIAYNPREGFIDPFGGIECLKGETGIVDAIIISPADDKEEETPFVSNPVSILHALGYYSSGDYEISPVTKENILKHKDSIKNITGASLRTEFSWVLRGKKVSTVLEEYAQVFLSLIPELAPMENFNLKRPEHSYDALTHTFKSVGYASPILTLRYAMLFHALGIPDCFSIDEKGTGHFYGHSERSWIYAKRIMKRMGFSEDEMRDVGFIIRNQSFTAGPDRRSLKLKLREIPSERLKLLLQFRYADLKSQSPDFEGAAMTCKRQVDAVNEIVAMKECYTPGQLSVNRYDLIQKKIVHNDEQASAILEKLLDMVLDAPNFNTRTRLLGAAEKMMQNVTRK